MTKNLFWVLGKVSQGWKRRRSRVSLQKNNTGNAREKAMREETLLGYLGLQAHLTLIKTRTKRSHDRSPPNNIQQ